ncbi:MAG: hypothetical protein QOD77_8 [Thermoplasmata archaeon]|jgi:KaiC/GvpD/RAD55 family RecA-like ATPase|nr:hypothetical protein [Thermoplasmata archaeon]
MAADKVSTGIEPLDAFLKGGLPRGFTTLLLAPAGSGAEIFAKQFAAGHDEQVIYVTTDESVGEVEAMVAEARWDFSRVQVVDLQTQFADAMLEAQQKARDGSAAGGPRRTFDPRELVEGTSSFDLLRPSRQHTGDDPDAGTDYLGRLLDPYSRLRPPNRVIVHSIDFFLNLYPVERVVSVLTALKAANSRQAGLLLLVLSKGAHGPTVERRLELLADCLIELEVTRKGTTFERFLMVKKVKNRSYGIGVSTYDITPQGFHLETLERIV